MKFSSRRGKQDVGNDARRDGGEYVVPVDSYPLIPARRRLQTELAPVVDNVMTITVRRRKPLTLVPIVVRNGTARPRRVVVNRVGVEFPPGNIICQLTG